MEQLIFLLVVAIIGFVNWLLNRSKQGVEEEGQKLPGPNPFAPRQPKQQADGEQERIRRFMEALGVPPEMPKPKATEPKPRPVSKAPKAQEKPKVLPIPKPVPVKPVQEEVFEPVAPVVRPVQPEERAAALAGLAELLRNRESVRSSIVLREILGPPRGLQSWK